MRIPKKNKIEVKHRRTYPLKLCVAELVVVVQLVVGVRLEAVVGRVVELKLVIFDGPVDAVVL